ncbi:MAG: hypothetical protein Q7S57_01975 [bacterium]|nr:hypothetical protein [bacterium]
MDHLVVYPERELNKLCKKRRARIVWVRKRREPPVGVVNKGDLLYFKGSGGGVVGLARVLKVKDFLRGGRYVVSLGISKPRVFKMPFSVIKRDRRSWVVCNSKNNIDQQPLFALQSPTLADCIKAVKSHYRGLPGNKLVLETVQYLSENKDVAKQSSGLLFLLAIILAEKNGIDLQEELRHLLAKQSEKVSPLAVFRGK